MDDDDASRQLSALRVSGVLLISLILVAAGMYAGWRAVVATSSPTGPGSIMPATDSGSGLVSAAWPGNAPVLPSTAASSQPGTSQSTGTSSSGAMLGPCELTPAGGYLKAAVSVTASGPWNVQISVADRTATVRGSGTSTAVVVIGPFPSDDAPQVCQAILVNQP